MKDLGENHDGYHTFNELYEHRHLLFLNLMWAYPDRSWASQVHEDGSSYEGYFIAGIHLPTGDITYHLPMKYWADTYFCRGKDKQICIMTLDKAPHWDGHTSEDVLTRLKNNIRT